MLLLSAPFDESVEGSLFGTHLKNWRKHRATPDILSFQVDGKYLYRNNSAETRQKNTSCSFCDQLNAPNVIGSLRRFTWWSFQVMPPTVLIAVYHTWLKNQSEIPWVWAFSDGKTNSANFSNSKPAQVISDYDGTIIGAVETELPKSTPIGCYFYFTEALYRNTLKLGLSVCHKKDERMRMLCRFLMSTAF